MKHTILFILLAGTLFMTGSCKKDKYGAWIYSVHRVSGFWVPFEAVGEGFVRTGDLSLVTIFGPYAESVVIESDYSYTPVKFMNETNIEFLTNDKGTFTVSQSGVIKMNGTWPVDGTILKLGHNEMWMNVRGVIYKFRRRP